MRYLINIATSCKQVATFTCKKSPITGKISIFDKYNNIWNKNCHCPTGSSCALTESKCNCDGVNLAGSLEESSDTKTFGNKDFLPLSKITVTGMDNADKYQMFSLGPVECTIANTKASSTNIARGKATDQSSTNYGGVSGRAVDGNKDVRYTSGASCTHTDDNNDEPWWSVDLGKPYLVHSVRITNRDDPSERLSNFDITVDNHL
eukprot:Seg1833.4 transcript_id=Seg1833.4/GoldUCD/mRNA.D3Y31 product=Fucolectin-1 protein_id=Seg1833.4/GoldUCD/D3Y31